MDNDIVISVNNVSKDFKLPHEKADSLKSVFVNPFNKNRKKYELQHALHDISFNIPKGEFFGIVGRNGSGKSTLLKIIAGIYQPSQGDVSVRGRLVPFIELGVGFNPELTGRENVYLNGALMGFSEKEVDDKYSAIVDFAEIERFMDQKLKNYSSGMQVRLAFSVATILAESDILLIDEVLAVGDADFQRKCFNYFKRLKKANKTVVFVSHDMSAVREYCDRAVLIEDSELKKIGTADEVASLYDKMFLRVDNNQIAVVGDESERWGEGQVMTKSVKVTISDKLVVILQEIEAFVTVDSIIVGFRIRDASGRDVTGTNTKIEKKIVGRLKRGEKVQIEWSLPNIIADGDYSVDPAIILSDNITTADWWDGAISFTIKKPRQLPYVVDPGFDVKIIYDVQNKQKRAGKSHE